MLIAPALPEDLPALAALERDVFASEVYPAFFFRQAHDLWPRWLLVARADASSLSGYVLAAPAHDTGNAWLLSAATAPAARGRGIGSQLLTSLLATLRADGVQRVRLTVHPQNRARHLYARHGFRLVAEDAAYFGAHEPRQVLELVFA